MVSCCHQLQLEEELRNWERGAADMDTADSDRRERVQAEQSTVGLGMAESRRQQQRLETRQWGTECPLHSHSPAHGAH